MKTMAMTGAFATMAAAITETGATIFAHSGVPWS